MDDLPDPDGGAADALIAGTVALMTTWAHPCGCGADAEAQRRLIARKLASNLGLLAVHPALSPPLRAVMARARERWLAAAAPATVWH